MRISTYSPRSLIYLISGLRINTTSLLGGSLRATWLLWQLSWIGVSVKRKGGLRLDAKYWEIFSSFWSMRRDSASCHHVYCHFGDRHLDSFHLHAQLTIIFLSNFSEEFLSTQQVLPQGILLGKILELHWHQILWKALMASVALVLFKWCTYEWLSSVPWDGS